MKIIIYLLLFLIVYSCSQNLQNKASYVLDGIQTVEYTNQYDTRDRIIRSYYTTTTQYMHMPEIKSVDAYEDLFFYNDSDKLIKKESYAIYNEIRVLSSIADYSNDMDVDISFREYPDDTLSYTYRKKDKEQHIIEEFSRYNLPDAQSETVDRMLYDDEGRLTSLTSEDIISKRLTKREYQYQTIKDTLVTLESMDGTPFQRKKNYYDVAKQAEVEVNQSLDTNTLDTVYTIANRTYSISYDYEVGYKQETVADTDSLGNWLKVEIKTWKKE